MLKPDTSPKIYIDALALVPKRKSGVGLTLEQTLKRLSAKPVDIRLVVPLGKAKYLGGYLGPNVSIKTLYLPARLMEVLLRLRLFPPVDWLLGYGVYVFPNYRNWPVWRSRSITYVYDVGFIKFPETVQPKNRKYLSRYIKRWISRTDKVVTITNQVRDEIEKELSQPYNKIAVVYCGVDPAVFYRRTAGEVAAAKEKYALSFKDYILYVGNIEPRKNLKNLLDAYETLPPELQEKYGLVIVGGDGWLNDEFYRRFTRARQSGKKVMQVNDYVQTGDLPALYSGAALLVQPAVYEGFGMTTLEAMACETPVAASDIPAIREIVQGSAFYFDPFDTGSLGNAISKGLTDRRSREKYIRDGKKRANELTWQQSADDLYEIIEAESNEGPHKRPILRRLKSFYVACDSGIREFLGEKAFSPYTPEPAANDEKLRAIIYRDFLNEQPSYAQVVTLKTYLFAKHLFARILKLAYHGIRG